MLYFIKKLNIILIILVINKEKYLILYLLLGKQLIHEFGGMHMLELFLEIT